MLFRSDPSDTVPGSDVLTNFGGPTYQPVVGAWGPPTAGFAVSNPAGIFLLPGQSSTPSITVSAVAGYSFPASFRYNLTSVPAGWNVTLGPDSPTITVITPANSPGGYYTINFSVTGSGVTHLGALRVSLFAASCTLNPTTIQGIAPGGATVNNAAKYAAYSQGGVPPYSYQGWTNWAPDLSPDSATLNQTATWNNHTTAGTFGTFRSVNVSVQDSTGLTSTASCTDLSITPNTGFSISAVPSQLPQQPIRAGGPGINATITVRSIYSFSGNVSINAVFPAGWSGTLSPAIVYVPQGGTATATLYMAAPVGSAAGLYTATIGASPSPLNAATFRVQVVQEPGIAIAYQTPPPTQGSRAVYSIVISNPNISSVSLPPIGQSSLPAGVNAIYSSYNLLPAGKEQYQVDLTLITTGNVTPLGVYTIPINVTIGGVTYSVNATLTVQPPDQSGQPTREYIYVGGRLVAIENAAAPQ